MKFQSSKSVAWLIYRPVMDYEESLTPYLFCRTKKDADMVLKNIRDFMDSLMKRLPDYPQEGPGEEVVSTFDADWERVDTVRRNMLDKSKWPYGIDNLRSDIQFGASIWDSGSIAAMPLPIVTP